MNRDFRLSFSRVLESVRVPTDAPCNFPNSASLARAVSALRKATAGWLGGCRGSGASGLHRCAIQRPTSLLVAAAIVLQALSPLAQALQLPSPGFQPEPALPDSAMRYGQIVQLLNERLGPGPVGERGAALRVSPELNLADQRKQLDYHFGKIQAHQRELLESWRAKAVAPEIIARELERQAQLAERHARLTRLLEEAQSPSRRGTQAASERHGALTAFLADEVPAPRPQALDPAHLPWQSPLADLERLRAPYGEADAKAPGPRRQSLARQPASTGANQSPDAFDLAPTGDAPHTPAIQALAASLNNNPLAIYQWVHDHIVFTPTYGSVQGAQDTLDKRSGNAFDQASLLIALLRSAGISARYVVGTIEVPEDKLRNWLGDYKTIDAAQQILGQGGIPNVAMVRGGRVDALRLEHAWVEAHLSFYPSRGARHIAGVSQGDTWVPMDASYKQYTYTAGVDLGQQVSFDAQAFADAARIGASINEPQGWVQNLNQSNIERDLDAYQARLKTHVDSRYPNATVGDILGTRKIIPDTAPYFAGTLKTTITATAARFSALPETLRAQFRYRLFSDAWSASMDSPELTFQQPTSELAGKKLTLAWVPASDADRQAIEALLPAPNPDGSPIRPDQLPQGLPGSINLKAEIRVEGQAIATSRPYRAGAEPVGKGGFTRYASLGLQGGADRDDSTDLLVAGQQSAIGLSIQGISKTQLETLKTRMETTKTKLQQVQANPTNTQPLDDLTGDILAGDLLTANIWSWWAEHQSHGRISAAQSRLTTQDPHNTWQRDTSGMDDRPALGYGMFHSVAVPTRLYGTVTTGVRFKGVMMDISHMRAIRWVKDSRLPQNAPANADAQTETKNRWIAYNRMRGQYASALEHAIPERFFNDPATCNAPGASATTTPPFDPTKPACAQAVSAVKAIAIAAAEGQKIFTITQANAAQAIPQLRHSRGVMEEIHSAVQAGKEVTIHEKAISAHGFNGAGYIVIDPETGGGAYLIEGGARGAVLLIFIGALFTMLGLYFVPLLATANALVPYFLLVLGALGLEIGLVAYLSASDTMKLSEFLQYATSLRMYAAAMIFTVLATPIAFQVWMTSSIMAIMSMVIGALS